MDECYQACVLHFVSSYTATNKPRNQHILSECTVSTNHKLSMINYHYSLVFFMCMYGSYRDYKFNLSYVSKHIFYDKGPLT